MGFDIETIFDINKDTKLYNEYEDVEVEESLELWYKWLRLKEEIQRDYMLRMESDNFIMIINKNTGEYFNLYEKDFSKEYIKYVASILEKHDTIKED